MLKNGNKVTENGARTNKNAKRSRLVHSESKSKATATSSATATDPAPNAMSNALTDTFWSVTVKSPAATTANGQVIYLIIYTQPHLNK